MNGKNRTHVVGHENEHEEEGDEDRKGVGRRADESNRGGEGDAVNCNVRQNKATRNERRGQDVSCRREKGKEREETYLIPAGNEPISGEALPEAVPLEVEG